MNSDKLMREVATVMADVLVHQRSRWGTLQGHHRQYEGWWKAEMALALESWTWRADLQELSMAVLAEAKPRDFGIQDGPPSADLLVAPWDTPNNRWAKTTPRVWIELKERGTWWGNAAKAFGESNDGLRHDLKKWAGLANRTGEIVLICQITTHATKTADEAHLPADWSDQFEEIGNAYAVKLPSRCVGMELPGTGIRWTRFDAFVISAG